MTQLSKKQFELLTKSLGPLRTQAAHAVLFDGVTDGAAERVAHGQKTRTVRRDVNRIQSELARAVEIADAGNCATLADFIEAHQDEIDAYREQCEVRK